MDKPYWEAEEPLTAYGERIMLLAFPKAKKLQIAQIWDAAPNKRKQGKTVVLSEDDMNDEMQNVLAAYLKAVK